MLPTLPTVSYPDAVRVTAAELDVVAPGWHDRLDLSRLDMVSTADCVAGQLFGRHADGLAALTHHRGGPPPDRFYHREHLYAFCATCSTALWRREVAARRRVPVAS